MAIALTQFEAMVGFRPVSEISDFLDTFPEFAEVIGTEAVQKFRVFIGRGESQNALRSVFSSLVSASQDVVTAQVGSLVSRLSSLKKEHSSGSMEELVLRLNTQFPNDVGIFCLFLLNVVHLEPGQAIFLHANEPHAYLHGDCIECMATSDNVVRAGLTPKYKDVETLTSMLYYESFPARELIFSGDIYKSTKHTKLYASPVDEFSVLKTELPSGSVEVIPPIDGPSIALVVDGEFEVVADKVDGDSTIWTKGQSSFIKPGVQLTMKSTKGTATLYRAFCAL
jgi:mannose-6-phosphate isomerase